MVSSRPFTFLGACLVTAVTLIAASGPASADPARTPLIETTCSYEQLESALQVEAPQLAARLAQNPDAQNDVRNFLALSVDQRHQRVQEVLARNPGWQQKIDKKRATPEGQEKVAMMKRVADTCHGY